MEEVVTTVVEDDDAEDAAEETAEERITVGTTEDNDINEAAVTPPTRTERLIIREAMV